MKIVYLHGFASVGNSNKGRALKAKFGEENVITPDLPIDPKDVVTLIHDIVRKNKGYPLIFVGTSLGGFYANYFAQRYDAPCVLVNPCTQPQVTIAKWLGVNKNYATGEDFIVTKKYLQDWDAMSSVVSSDQNGALINLFLAEDDDVIDYNIALNYFPHTNYKVITKDGGHRYEKHWDEVMTYLENMVK